MAAQRYLLGVIGGGASHLTDGHVRYTRPSFESAEFRRDTPPQNAINALITLATLTLHHPEGFCKVTLKQSF